MNDTRSIPDATRCGDISPDLIDCFVDSVTVEILQYDPQGQGFAHPAYREAGTKELVTKDGTFSGSVGVGGAGYYLIKIDSPKNIPYPGDGPGATEWAEFVVEVK
ncbi:hypothetical protein [Cohnella zeiphila]|uniref:Uncharacterized protein n=1 Tax=Cohnella zeiphila TaxID=2761120 RepID=A0A7X0SPD7_9BACL|nr:hypothetical protein [Cohnella zeiphila]MBB6731373.1 hypothetical protein [Cohnella zeiphila]